MYRQYLYRIFQIAFPHIRIESNYLLVLQIVHRKMLLRCHSKAMFSTMNPPKRLYQ
jgi:hypothetical protein